MVFSKREMALLLTVLDIHCCVAEENGQLEDAAICRDLLFKIRFQLEKDTGVTNPVNTKSSDMELVLGWR